MPKILLVEDDRRIRIEVLAALAESGLDAEVAVDIASAQAMLEHRFDLAVLDRGLPDGDGLELCATIQERHPGLPVLFLTARDDPAERVRGLETGADDYVVKPFHMAELLARVRSLLRRAGRQSTEDVVRVGSLWADRAQRTAGDENGTFRLRRREFDLLMFLLQNPGRPWSREQLLHRVWGQQADQGTRTVDIHVRRLRQQVEVDASQPQRLVTEFGVGYRLREDNDGEA
ncbi:MAG: response regulator transcription factor [Planctomycetota bacterium]